MLLTALVARKAINSAENDRYVDLSNVTLKQVGFVTTDRPNLSASEMAENDFLGLLVIQASESSNSPHDL